MRFLTVLALCAGMTGAASAGCEHPPMPWQFGETFSSTWHITGGSSCKTTSRHPEVIAAIEITARPRNGIAGKDGLFGVAYKPNEGFKGSDTFSYAVTSNASHHGGAGRVASWSM
jgi:hypothetical protein